MEDPAVRAEINRILNKANVDKNSLSDADKAFLRARSSYLGRRTREEMADILKPADIKTEERKTARAARSKRKAEEQSQKDQNAHLEPKTPDEEIG